MIPLCEYDNGRMGCCCDSIAPCIKLSMWALTAFVTSLSCSLCPQEDSIIAIVALAKFREKQSEAKEKRQADE